MAMDRNGPPPAGQGTRSPALRLVHPSPPSPPRPKGKRPRLFSPEEDARVRAALRNARTCFGGWAPLAAALHMAANTVCGMATGNRPVTADAVLRLARALNVPAETLYRPGLTVLRRPCPTCGGDGAA